MTSMMRKPKKHNQHLSSKFVPPKLMKTSVQKPLFEEQDEDLKIPENTQKDPPMIQPEPEPEPRPEPLVIIDKKGDEVATVETPVPIYEEPPVVEKTEPCEQCKEPIIYLSDDRHPGIICKKCGHGQNNPNLKGKEW